MRAPRLNIRLAIETAERQADGGGGYRWQWRHLGWLWAAMEAGRAVETDGGAGPVAAMRWRISLRGARFGDPRRPLVGQRFRMGQRLFLIEAVAERGGQGVWLDCMTSEELER